MLRIPRSLTRAVAHASDFEYNVTIVQIKCFLDKVDL